MIKTRSLTQTTEIIKNAIIKGRPVTISYVKADGTHTVRTIEAYEIRETQAGDLIVKAADRQSRASRTFRLDRVTHLTVHRSRYLLKVPSERTVVKLAMDHGHATEA